MIDLSQIGLDAWIDRDSDLWAGLPVEGRRAGNLGGDWYYRKETKKQAREREFAPGEELRFTVSLNMKTGSSLNFLIGPAMAKTIKRRHPGTCHPTEWCAISCYARIGKQSLPPAVGVQYINTLLTEEMLNIPRRNVGAWAKQVIAKPLKRWGLDNLRFNAVGDFSPGVVHLFNALAEAEPGMFFWGFSRRADSINLIEPLPNVHVNISLDPTTPGVPGAKEQRRRRDRGKGPWHVEELYEASEPLRARDLCDFVWADTHPESRALVESMGSLWAPAVLFGFHGLPTYADRYGGRTVEKYRQFYKNTSGGRVSMDYAPPLKELQCPATMVGFKDVAWCQVCRWCVNKRKRVSTTALTQYHLHERKGVGSRLRLPKSD